MGEAASNTNIHSMLQGCLLFEEADSRTLEQVVSLLEAVDFKRGEPIILENEVSDHVYFIQSGLVEIVKYVADAKRVQRVAVLREGAHFSELSVLSRSSKSASAFALEDSVLLRMSGADFLGILRKTPKIATSLVKSLAQLNYNLTSDQATIPPFQRSLVKPTGEMMNVFPAKSWARFAALPMSLSANTLRLALMQNLNVELFQQLRSTHPAIQAMVYLIHEKDYIDLEAQLQAAQNGGMPPAERLEPFADPKDLVSYMSELPYLKGLPESAVQQMASFCKRYEYKSGELIFIPGKPSEQFYIVESGKVELSKPVGQTGATVHVGYANAGDFLGHVSMLLAKPHSSIARAVGGTRVIVFPRPLVDRLLETPIFSIPLAQALAQRMQDLGKTSAQRVHRNENFVPNVQGLSHLLPKSIMLEYRILPLRLNENELTLGVVDPDNDYVSSLVSRYLKQYRVSTELITEGDFKKWSFGIEGSSPKEARTPASNKAETGNASKQLDRILNEGLANRASDLHFEPTAEGFICRYRIDGVLRESETKIPKSVGKEIINRIKVLSQMDISIHTIPQDGQLKMALTDGELTARVSTLPTKFGENAVLRLIRSRNSIVPLSMLAPDRRTIQILKQMTKYKQGLFLITGPTGSGKTTTLYSMLNDLNNVDINIVTLEDPVELEIMGTTQVEMNDKQGLNFSKALRSTLRQDPDVIMVGEIRDGESAKIVFDAAMTGHLVISTLHTNSSLEVVLRLRELGVPSGVIASGLIGALAQRLVRATCKHCKYGRPLTPSERELFARKLPREEAPQELFQGKGCSRCSGTGYHDRIPIYEIWRRSPEMESALAREATRTELLEAARLDQFDTMVEFALKMVRSGLTTLEEVDRAFNLAD